MSNSEFAADRINSLLATHDCDLYDKSGFLRFRNILGESDDNSAVRVWHNDNPYGDITEQRAIDFIAERLDKGWSQQSDFIWK